MRRNAYYLGLYCTQGVKLLWRNRFWSMTTLIVMSLLLSVVYVVAALQAHTEEASRRVDDRLVITAVVAQDDQYRSVVDALVLKGSVEKIPFVREVRVVTEEETRRRFLENVKGLQTDPDAAVFTEALEVSVTETSKMEDVQTQIKRISGVQDATYLGELVKRLTAVTDYIRTIAMFGVIFLTLISFLVVMSVVRVSIHSERRSVQTMASVGGSLMTIALPLLVQMTLVTLAACSVASLMGWWVDPQLGSAFGGAIRNLPDWLQTGRAYGPFALFPYMFGGAVLSVAMIVMWGTWRYVRSASR